MDTALSPGKTASAIWSRVVKPEQGDLAPEVARAILKLDFAAADLRRVDELSEKTRRGALAPEERAELEELIRVDLELAVLKSKARVSLKSVQSSL